MSCNASYTRFILKGSFGDRKYLGTHLNTNKKSIQFKINEFFLDILSFLREKWFTFRNEYFGMWQLRSRGRMLDWPQQASNGMRPSLRPVWSRALIGGTNQLMVVGPYRAARIQKVERGWGHRRWSSLWPISLSHITLGPITKVQRRRESSTPLWVSPDPALFILPEPTPCGSTSTSPTRTSTLAPTMLSSLDKPSGETRQP
jgi:hypothetical protein